MLTVPGSVETEVLPVVMAVAVLEDEDVLTIVDSVDVFVVFVTVGFVDILVVI